MNITVRVGPKTHQVKEPFLGTAEYFDGNKDGRVTLSEIETANANLPDGMTVDETDKSLATLAKNHKSKAEVVTIGESQEGHPIRALRVSQDVNAATTGGLSTYADSQGLVGITMEIGTSFQPDPKDRDGIVNRASDGIVEFVRQMDERSQAS